MSFNKLILIEVSCYMSEPLTELNGNILDQSGGNTILHILIIKLMKMAKNTCVL